MRNRNLTERELAPITILAKKQKVGTEDADAIGLPLLIALDAAKRGRCPNSGANELTRHLIVASYIAMRVRSKAFHDQVTKAYAALKKASDRPTQLLDLTTGEYRAISAAVASYVNAIAGVEVGIMDEANRAAERMLAP